MALKREPLTMEDREEISRGLAKGLDNPSEVFTELMLQETEIPPA